jgi:hypothetical protein
MWEWVALYVELIREVVDSSSTRRPRINFVPIPTNHKRDHLTSRRRDRARLADRAHGHASTKGHHAPDRRADPSPSSAFETPSQVGRDVNIDDDT